MKIAFAFAARLIIFGLPCVIGVLAAGLAALAVGLFQAAVHGFRVTWRALR